MLAGVEFLGIGWVVVMHGGGLVVFFVGAGCVVAACVLLVES